MRYTLLDCQEWALERKGVCTSLYFSGYRQNMSWKCKYGHEWNAPPYKIKKGDWCKVCLENQFKHLMGRALLQYIINQARNP